MKNKKIIMKIFTIIISFILLISMFISVEASGYIKFEDVNTAVSNVSDISGEVAVLSKLLSIIQLIKVLLVISFWILLAIGVISLIKKQIKKGIICIIIAIISFCIIGIFSIVFHAPVNIQP